MLRVLSSISVVALLLGACAHAPQAEHTAGVPYHQITKAPPAVMIAKPVIVAAPAPIAKQTLKHRLHRKLFRERAVPHVIAKPVIIAPAIVAAPVVTVVPPVVVTPAEQTFKQRWLNLFFRKRA